MQNMISRILEIDREAAPLKIVELEKKHFTEISAEAAGRRIDILLGGTIDRVDELDSVVRILDYKSGKDSLYIDNMESLTAYNVRNRNSAAFQTFVYSLIYSHNNPAIRIRPSLYPVRSIYSANFSDIFSIKKGDYRGEVADFNIQKHDFGESLKEVISDIFNPQRDFDMTGIKENCTYCPFSGLCGRYEVT